MAVHQAGYNFHPGDPVWYIDPKVTPATVKEARCYQVEIKQFKKPDGTSETKLSYLIAVDGKTTTIRVKESDLLRKNEAGQLVPPPVYPTYTVTYRYAPDAKTWFVDRTVNGVKYGTVFQTEIKIHAERDGSTHAKTTYYVSFVESAGTVTAKDSDLFDTAPAAWANLGINFGPTPTPLPVTPLPNNGGDAITTVSKINGDIMTLFRGQPVYIDQATGKVARASNDATALTFLGFVYDSVIPVGASGRIITEGTINNTTSGWEGVIADTGGLMVGSRYFLSSLGMLSPNAPTEGYSRQVGMAASETELDIRTNYAIKL